MNQNNIGRFCIPLESIKKTPDEVASLFRQMNLVVVRAEIIDFGRFIDYIGLSDRFREVKENEQPPYYEFEYMRNPDGTTTVSSFREG